MQILLPVRSNRHWFSTSKSVSQLERVLKCYMVMYERVIVQDGQYVYCVVEDGSVLRASITREMLKDRSHPVFIEPSGTAQLSFGVKSNGAVNTVWEKNIRDVVVVDFLSVLAQAGVSEDECWDFKSIDLSKTGKEKVAELLKPMEQTPHYSSIPANFTEHKTSLGDFFHDAYLAREMGLPFLCGYKVGSATNRGRPSSHFTVSPGSAFYRNWIQLGFPDFGDMDWEDVQKLRNSTAGRDFREMVARISEDVASSLSKHSDSSNVQIQVASGLIEELVAVVNRMRLTPGKIICGLAISPVPILSTLATLPEYAEQKNSWVSMLFRNEWF